MTKATLKKICKDLQLYQTPYLNDVLYLHFKGIVYVSSLVDSYGVHTNNGQDYKYSCHALLCYLMTACIHHYCIQCEIFKLISLSTSLSL